MNELDQLPFGAESFADNPEPRCPVVLLLDSSYSMSGEPIQRLNEGIQALKNDLTNDKLAAKRVEIAVVTFGPVETLHGFEMVDNFFPPMLQASNNTPMGEAIIHGLQMLEDRKKVYKDNGIGYFRPWVMLITDGAPTDEWTATAKRVKEGETKNSFAFFAIGVEDGNMEILGQISARTPMRLKGLQFKELFLWLSRSMSSVSRSSLGDSVPLEDPTAPTGWAFV